ncbi:MAG: hypothetical protein ACLFTT_00820 [Candidatus Hydrogenedentota bacterium]
MPVKYECPKCGRRFAEWGAEKLGFKCPHDERCPASALGEDIRLTRVGTPEKTSQPAPSLRRQPKAPPAPEAEAREEPDPDDEPVEGEVLEDDEGGEVEEDLDASGGDEKEEAVEDDDSGKLEAPLKLGNPKDADLELDGHA